MTRPLTEKPEVGFDIGWSADDIAARKVQIMAAYGYDEQHASEVVVFEVNGAARRQAAMKLHLWLSGPTGEELE